jgi:hypothetical protein
MYILIYIHLFTAIWQAQENAPFIQSIDAAIRDAFASVSAKRLGDVVLTGSSMAQALRAVVDGANDGNMQVRSLVDAVYEATCRNASRVAIDTHQRLLSQRYQVDGNDNKLHQVEQVLSFICINLVDLFLILMFFSFFFPGCSR